MKMPRVTSAPATLDGFSRHAAKISSLPAKHLAVLIFSFLCHLGVKAQDTNYYTPAQYLAMQPVPVFKPGHQLPELTTDGVQLPMDLGAKLTTNWGYAFDLGSGLTTYVNGGYTYPQWPYPLQALLLAETNHFPCSVHLDRFWSNPSQIPTNWVIGSGMWCTNSAGMIIDSSSNFWANVPSNYWRRVISPEAPPSEWTNVAALTAAPLKSILSSNINVVIILNDGEYGLGVPAAQAAACWAEPRVQAAMATNGLTFPTYTSIQKSNQMRFISAAVRAAVPHRQFYIGYNFTGEEQFRYTCYGTNWDANWYWGWNSGMMNPTVDLPSFENYYQGPLFFTNPPNASLSTGYDLLTKYLNGIGYDIAIGATNHTYDWVSGGWSVNNTNVLADIPTFMGFLKCLYIAGMIGCNAGYYIQPPATNVPSIFGEWATVNHGDIAFNGKFPTNIPPHWLLQEIAVARVHALFSYQDTFLFNSDLLPGNGQHVEALDQPSYEFTNSLGNKNIRTLARKLRGTNEWLICCWAPSSPSTNVTVNIPILGTVNLLARPSGAVYLATTNSLMLQDTNGIYPTEWMALGSRPAPPTGLRQNN